MKLFRSIDSGNNTKGYITNVHSDVRDSYQINSKELGHGHYGIVRKCKDRKTGEFFAIKTIKKSKVKRIQTLHREIQILKEMDHPNIIKLVSIHEDKKYLHLITELCEGGELFDRIISKTQTEEGCFSERDASNLVRGILKAIRYCHDEMNIVHRDLKPENFLFLTKQDDSPIKIIDFGLSRFDDADVMTTKVGTPYYVAPEVLKREYTKACDMWSIGVITYILLCGYPPFYGENDKDIFNSVKTGRFDFPNSEWDDISSSAKDFITALLKLIPSERLTAKQALNHPWITQGTRSFCRSDLLQRRNSVKANLYSNYMAVNKLKKAVLGYVATQMTKEELADLRQIFDDIDTNNDGYITLKELDEALICGNYSANLRNHLFELRKELNIKPDAVIMWNEFVAQAISESYEIGDGKIEDAFHYYRSSSLKHIRECDLIDICGENQAKEIIDQVDVDGDGRISFDEFKKIFKDDDPMRKTL